MRGFLLFATSFFVLIFLPVAQGQDCDPYTGDGYWIPNEISEQGDRFIDSEVWNDSLVMIDESGVHVVDFPEPQTPTITLQLNGSFSDLAIQNDIAALVNNGAVELVSLPDWTSLATLEGGRAYSFVAIDQNFMVAAGGDLLQVYDISDPNQPLAKGSCKLEGEFSNRVFGRLAFQGTTVVSNVWGGNNFVGYVGYLIALDVSDPDLPVITDIVDRAPIEEEWEDTFFIEVVPHEPGFVVTGFLFYRDPYPYPNNVFLGRFKISPDGKIEWNGIIEEYGHYRMGLAIDFNSALFSTTHRDYLVNIDWSRPDLDYSSADHLIPESHLSWLPGIGVLSSGAHTFYLNEWRQGFDSNGIINTTCQTSALNKSTAVMLYWRRPADPGDGGSWVLSTYDLSESPAVKLDSFLRTYESVEAMHIVGNRAYLARNGVSYVHVSDDGQIGELQPTSLRPFGPALNWDGFVILSHDDNYLAVYSTNDNDDLILESELRVSQGDLTRVLNLLLVKDESHISVVDLSDPLNPVVTNNMVMPGRLKFFEPDILFQIEGSVITWYDASNIFNPSFLGRWDAKVPVYDLHLSGNRLYLGMGSYGLSVQEFDPSSGLQTLGGRLNLAVSYLQPMGKTILATASQPILLPLECGDPLPVTVSGFHCEANDNAVGIRWNCSNLPPLDAHFKIDRNQGSSSITIFRGTARLGNFHIMDQPDSTPGPVSYRLELCDKNDDCQVLGQRSLILENRNASLKLSTRPNPANPRTTIQFELVDPGIIKLGVYDLAGKRLLDLISEYRLPGSHEVTWDGNDHLGQAAASGSYILRLETDSGIRTTRLSLIR